MKVVKVDAEPYIYRIREECENAPQLKEAGAGWTFAEAVKCSKALDCIMEIIEEWENA